MKYKITFKCTNHHYDIIEIVPLQSANARGNFRESRTPPKKAVFAILETLNLIDVSASKWYDLHFQNVQN